MSVAPGHGTAPLRSTRAEIDLGAIRANVSALRAHSRAPDFMAVVKADAYGHGAGPVAAAALSAGATWLGVYTVSEGVQLRESGIQAPILVFGSFTPAEAGLFVKFALRPTIMHSDSGRAISSAARGKRVPCHIKIDSGLGRSGVSPDEADDLLGILASLPGLEAEGIFTHFACADEPNRPETMQQLRVFLDTVSRLERAGYTFPLKHAANSAATLQWPETHLDMVRCGISIYGYYPSAETARAVDIRPALALVSEVTRVHRHPRGTGVGYGHEFVCPRDARVALVPIGYADGFRRALGCGNGRVLVRGQSAPVIGRVSMDQITVDVTDIPTVERGDVVTLIGDDHDTNLNADEVAAAAGTISYDILTGISPRVPRVYRAPGNVELSEFAAGVAR